MDYFLSRKRFLLTFTLITVFLIASSSINHSLVKRRVKRSPAEWPITQGYIASGDSYAAGMGTGTTSSDTCRVGSNNFADLFIQWTHNDNLEYQKLMCSGDTLVGVNRQISEWKNPSRANLATLSVGGNDVGFSDLVKNCLLTMGSYSLSEYRIWCLEAQVKAYQYMDDQHETGLHAKLKDTYKRIIQKSGRDDFYLYVTGYVEFFDSTDNTCDHTTFFYWSPSHYPWRSDLVMLTQALRQQLNALVYRLNTVIESAVAQANRELGQERVVFVETDWSFKGHRWCEPGVPEPVEDREDTWFFLSGWKDMSYEGYSAFDSPEAAQIEDFKKSGGLKLPDPSSCKSQLGSDPDPWCVWLCDAAESAQKDPGGRIADEINATNAGDIRDQHIDWKIPTRQIKTFHPRTRGMIAYRDVLIRSISYFQSSLQNQNKPETPGLLGGSMSLKPAGIAPGKAVKKGTKLRILGVGDSITVGFPNDGDGNGYRLQLRNDLSADEVVLAGTETAYGTFSENYFAAWSGKTIKYNADHVGPSLAQRPNIILLHAGTNDMNPNRAISVEGNDPHGAAERLGALIDQITAACPDATVLVAIPIGTCDQSQQPATAVFQSLVPGIVQQRRTSGHKVIAVDFSQFSTSLLRDCIHPSLEGYHEFGDLWYQFVSQIPLEWIETPKGPDPERSVDIDLTANGGLDDKIPPPDWGTDPVTLSSKDAISNAADIAGRGGARVCNVFPHWQGTGKIALGLGRTGEWKYHKKWIQPGPNDLAPSRGTLGKAADGLQLDPRFVRLHDMNGDGKADYLWIHPTTGQLTCWLNNLPKDWTPAGTNNGIIASGAGPAKSVYFADLNGDGLDDYLVVNPNNGAVDVYWNYGPDNSWENGWKFVPAGQIASGVPHANLGTLRFADINGDGRADYVYIGAGGSLGHWLNTGSKGGQDVLFVAQGGIATGASSNISNLVFADLNGDGRDDYLIWDDQAGLTGFLSQPTRREGVPLYINQGPPKTIADGITQHPSSIRLADLDGDGKDDYAYIDQNGAFWLWWNRGTFDTSMAIDGIRFADIDGDGLDDYIWLDPITGAPLAYINKGPDQNDILGWSWVPLNGGKPIASGASAGANVHFGDVDGDGRADYLVTDPRTGELTAYLNQGPAPETPEGWKWRPIGSIATGLGPGKHVRFADIDGDGYVDYIFLHPNSGTTIYHNVFDENHLDRVWEPMPDADASGINQRPEEISFHDINGDGMADYIWTRPHDGKAFVHINQYPQKPTWGPQTEIAGGVGTSGNNVRYAVLQDTGRASYVAVDPNNGAIAAWLSGCDNLGPPRRNKIIVIVDVWVEDGPMPTNHWAVFETTADKTLNVCDTSTIATKPADGRVGPYPPDIGPFNAHGLSRCIYKGDPNQVGRMSCPGAGNIRCERDEQSGQSLKCTTGHTYPNVKCRW